MKGNIHFRENLESTESVHPRSCQNETTTMRAFSLQAAMKRATIVKPGGFLIISGLLDGQQEDIINYYKNIKTSLELIKIEIKGDWVAVLLKNNK